MGHIATGVSTLAVAAVLGLTPAIAPAQTRPVSPSLDISYSWGLRIPMRDGAALGATLYRPTSGSGNLSTIVSITPYVLDRQHDAGKSFARKGFAYLAVDTRGRGNSDGVFTPLRALDGMDGHDVIEWVATQPWSNGKVVMRGGSYGGFNQWATAKHSPPHLKTIVPVAAPFPGYDFANRFNVQFPYMIQWATFTSGRTSNTKLFGDSDFWLSRFRQYHLTGMAYQDLDELVGNTSTSFDEWLLHPTVDAYWLAAAPTPDQFADIDIPILTISGYYDGDQPGALQYYTRHMTYGSTSGKANHYLLLGPWDHGGTRLPKRVLGGYEFGDAMMFDAENLDQAWYDWVLNDKRRPRMLKDRVNYFVAGQNRWKSAPDLNSIATGHRVLYLSSNGRADNLFASGTLVDGTSVSRAARFDRYVYDPLDTHKVNTTPPANFITDQSEVAGTSGDGLIYHSAHFDEDLEIAGTIQFHGWFELNVPDTDIHVSVYEILDNGVSVLLAQELMRARYRRSLDHEELISPGEVNEYTFSRFNFMSRLVKRGSRLRLFIRPGNNLLQQRNYNSGKPVHTETRADARTATVRLHHTKEYPSRLVLPIVAAK